MGSEMCIRDSIHTDTESSVKVNGKESEPFRISTGVRQGCTAAPDLFNCLLDYLMKQVSNHSHHGIELNGHGMVLNGHILKDQKQRAT